MSNLRYRQTTTANGDVVFYDDNDSWWYTKEGHIVRWALFFGIFGFFFIYILGGYMHAKRRIKKGLPPLAYHRWLLSRRQRAQYDPSYLDPHVYYNQYPPQNSQYGMHPMPPPIYDPDSAPPPTYQPPAGATKADPSQQWRAEPTQRPGEPAEPSPAYEAPPRPPPPAVTNYTGSSNNPFIRP